MMADWKTHDSSGVRRIKPGNTSNSSATLKGGQMQTLLVEFRGLYEGKLKRLDDRERAGEEVNKVSFICLFTS